MPEINSKSLKIIDWTIFVFIVIFLLSLSNSIFVNQLGYYGALLAILFKFSLTKKNQFSKTGLEFALGWYILADVISTILSAHAADSFHNLLKRALLVPIIYVIIASVKDVRDAKTIFKIYIGGTLITVLIYLYFSSKLFLDNMYGITESGPSIFQYPITASEILSFTVIFLFAFLVNERTTLRNKIFLLIGFSLSLLALFSTYKRTGWMGAVFGIFIILLIKKQWKVLIAGAALILIFFFTQKNISEVKIYEVNSNKLEPASTITTEGKAYNAYRLNNRIIVSDYDKGLAIYENGVEVKRIELPFAVTGFYHWIDNYFVAELADTRFILLKPEGNSFVKQHEFYSPGFTYSTTVANGCFYVLDKDSGLTIFTDPENLKIKKHIPALNPYSGVFADSLFLLIAGEEKGFSVFHLENALPEEKYFAADSLNISFFFYSTPFAFTENDKGFNIYRIDSTGIKFIRNFVQIKFVSRMDESSGNYFALTRDGDVFVFNQTDENDFKISAKYNPGFNPKSINAIGDSLILTRVESKQSRLTDIFNPYHQSNFTRFALWRAGIKMFFKRPLFGLGDIDLAEYYKQYKEPYHKEIQGHLHNNFVHILATLGLFGLMAVVYLFIKIILIDLNIFKNVKDIPFVSSYSIGALAAFCGFIISGLTELNFWDHEITTLIWFTFGLNIAFFKSVKPQLNSN